MIEATIVYLAIGLWFTVYELMYYSMERTNMIAGFKLLLLPMIISVLRTVIWPYYAVMFLRSIVFGDK